MAGNLEAIFGHVLTTDPDPAPPVATPEDQLLDAMMRAGLRVPDRIILDGKIHRFNSDEKKDKTGWYVGYGDATPAGAFGCWRAGIEETWRADIGRGLTPAEQMLQASRVAEIRRLRDEARAKLQMATADVVADIWEGAQDATDEHPYLAKKGVKSHGLKITGDGRLISPLYGPAGELMSLQYISHDGTKRYHQSGQTGGATWTLGSISGAKTLYIAEGYATAATVHEQTGEPCVVAYSASNLPAATEQAVRHGLPVVIIADNDVGGIGRKYADQACAKYGATYVKPPVVGMDANDWVHAGNALADILAKEPDDWLVKVTSDWLTQPAPIKWIIKGWMPEQCLGMLHGPSGSGKTFVMLDLAMHIATGNAWQGRATKPGAVVYLAGEGNYGLRSRVAAWMQQRGVQDANIFVSKSGCNLNTPDGWLHAMQYLRRVAQTHDIILVIVDTLHRFMTGNENSAEDTKTMIDACDAIKRELLTAVMLLHHTGHGENAQNRARGSSAWRGALDVEIGIAVNGDKKTLVMHKMKDAELAPSQRFELQKVAIDGWVDEDGEPVYGAIVDWLGEGESKEQGQIKRAVHEFARAWQACGARYLDGRPVITTYEWRNWLTRTPENGGAGIAESTARKKTTPTMGSSPSHTLGWLLAKGLLVEQAVDIFVFVDDDLFAVHKAATEMI